MRKLASLRRTLCLELRNGMHQPDSNRLFEQLRRGDEQALEQLFRRHYGELCQSLRRYVSDADMAEDLVQQVFIKLWEKRHSIQIERNAAGYLQRMAIREALQHLRGRQVLDFSAEWPPELATYDSPAEQLLLHNELSERLSRGLEQLPPACRTIFQLSRFEALSYREIADEMGLSIKTVENQMGKALRFLRGFL
jgi:RNA polymerase sigma-70 factor, ECF subfamily